MNGKPKDVWDKLDTLSKIGSGIILAIIALVLKIGTDNISSSLQTGSLVQSLIADLSAPDSSHIRQEIALVALDQTLWNRNQELVMEICERIVRNTDDYDQLTGELAYQILLTRDSLRAVKLYNEIANIQTVSPASSGPQTELVARVPEYTGKTVFSNIKLLNRVKQNVVYLHFPNEADRAKIKLLNDKFIEAGFSAPGIQRVPGNYLVDIRYFHNEDTLLVGNVEQIIKDFLTKKKYLLIRYL